MIFPTKYKEKLVHNVYTILNAVNMYINLTLNIY